MRNILAAAALAASVLVSSGARAEPAVCDVSAADRAWIAQALGAWRYSADAITGAKVTQVFDTVFFDGACVLVSPNALTAETLDAIIWAATPHDGEIVLPNGEKMPAGVTSFADAGGDDAFFVMSTPSLWEAAGVRNDVLGLETMMVAVLLHEGAHLAQADTYGARMSTLVELNDLPEDFSDDTVQYRFGDDVEFETSIARETELLFQAAAAPDRAIARQHAGEALALMRARHARWFVGADSYLTEAEEIWLTLEGAGQWAGYRWLIDPNGGGVSEEIAMAHFARRGRWWSQNEGIALALALDRIAGPRWRRDTFSDGVETLPAMLERALP
ncbi:MAG: hypothetical protein M0D54_18560 [Hyphomonadaceae bacterium JAD_PAG50586_4]|nr:MAG: hypothetical protein M0D54_18560 [Hyphomonadaceae bacterium JAD_PAG50586_4]